MRSARALGALAAVAGGALVAVAVPTGSALADTTAMPMQAVSFTTVGEHPFTVPPGVTSIQVVAIGGQGGGSYAPGGFGAQVEADVRVTPGSTIYAEVGGNGAPGSQSDDPLAAGGANGGWDGGAWYGGGLADVLGVSPDSGAGGGGASDLQNCPVASCQPIDTGSGSLLLVAGGGGGASGDSQGGNGGTPDGGNAAPGSVTQFGLILGGGATDTEPGNSPEEFGYGLLAGCSGNTSESFGGGAGGGGYYCGGGGGGALAGGGGGGGSSYGPAGASYSVTSQAPSVTITYPVPFALAPGSNTSLVLDGTGGWVKQQAPTGASTQLWELIPVQGSLYQIVNLATNQCITTLGIAGYPLFLWSCAVPGAANEWQLPANFGSSAGGSLIYNPSSGLYMDVNSGSTAAGGIIDGWPDNGGYPNQSFLTVVG